jgi:tetratricopeptide (TPR) repeat protein
MKKIIYFSLLLILSIDLFSQTPEEIFNKANEAYQHGDYKTAIESYNKIVSSGYGNGDLLYNLGNAYFKTGQFAPAILNYERAKKLNSSDEELNHNLAVANSRIKDRLERVPKLFILEWWEQIKNMFSISFYQYFVLFLFFIFIAVFTLFFWFKDYLLKKRTFFGVVALGIIFVFFSLAFTARVLEEKNDRYAILFLQSLKVKSSPDDSGTDIFEIHYGIKFQIVDELHGWYKIILADGKNGWIKKEGFEEI